MRIDGTWKAVRAVYNARFYVEGVDNHDPKTITDFYLNVDDAESNLHKVETEDDLHYYITRKTPSGATVRYIQRYEGIEVYDSGVAITVNNKDVISFVASEFKPGINIPSIFPKISKEAVLNVVMKEMDIREEHITFLESKTVVYARIEKQVLAWKISISATNKIAQSLEFLYDATNGENIHIKNLIVDKHGSGGKIRQGERIASSDNRNLHNFEKKNLRANLERDQPQRKPKGMRIFDLFKKIIRSNDDLCKQTVNVRACVFDPNPLASARASYGDFGGLEDDFDRSSPRLEEQLRTVTLEGVSFIDNRFHLIGKYAQIEDFDGPFDGIFTRPRRSDYLGTRDEDFFEAANAYYHINLFMQYVNEGLGFDVFPTRYEGGIKFDPHAADMQDNSYYDQLQERLGFGEGGVDDAEDADVIIHELAHFLHQSLTSDNISIRQGLAEGFADYIAVSYSRSKRLWTKNDPEYNWVFAWDGHNEFWSGRITNFDGKYPDDLIGVDHVDGQILSTCLMKVWDDIGRKDTDKIIMTGISYTGSGSNQEDFANAIVTAAKDLSYGSDDVDTIQEILEGCGYNISG